MAYTALYRKFRPQTFDEVKGQDHIVQTLKNQIGANRIGHAYLFCGTRGTGKTSIAKIFAKAVNCENPVDGSPCLKCKSCQAIAAGSSMNVVEIDAASNNGVDDVRVIREEVQYSPTDGKKKVYIIDEVHMLSTAAFNALLKTLEEPPEYVTFILATTEPHKLPITVLSRCQRYDFKRITIDTIAARLQELMQAENIEVEDKAIRYVARVADGSMRDALSLLDQCIAFYLGKKLTYENALEVLGAVDTEVFSRLVRSIIACDISGGLAIVDEMVVKGRELDQFVIDFIWYLRNLLLVKTSDNIEELIDASAERIASYKEEASLLEAEVLMRYIRIFSELSNQIKYSAQKRVLIEIALIKLNKPMMENDVSALINRISILESQLKNGIVVNQTPSASATPSMIEPAKPKELKKAVPEEVQYIVDNWGEVLAELPSFFKGSLTSGRLAVKGENTLLIVFTSAQTAHYVFCAAEDKVKLLEQVIATKLEKQVKVEVKQLENGQNMEDAYQLIEKTIGQNMTIVEEDF